MKSDPHAELDLRVNRIAMYDERPVPGIPGCYASSTYLKKFAIATFEVYVRTGGKPSLHYRIAQALRGVAILQEEA